MLSRKNVLDLIERGEGINIEFKQRFSSFEKISKEMIAFANTRGGVILMGVDDDKSLYGVESEKSDLELIKECAQKFCEPPIQYFIDSIEIQKKDLLIINIPESKFKPHRIQDYKTNLDLNTAQVYVRINDKSVVASKEMIKILQTQSNEVPLKNYSVGNQEKLVFNFLDNYETVTVKEFSKFANISERRASRTLIKLVRANLLLIHVKDSGESFFTYAG